MALVSVLAAQPSGRFEEGVVPFLKMVRYPFTISKSSLAAVGAPQTWPKVRTRGRRGGDRTCATSCTILVGCFHSEMRAPEKGMDQEGAWVGVVCQRRM